MLGVELWEVVEGRRLGAPELPGKEGLECSEEWPVQYELISELPRSRCGDVGRAISQLACQMQGCWQQ